MLRINDRGDENHKHTCLSIDLLSGRTFYKLTLCPFLLSWKVPSFRFLSCWEACEASLKYFLIYSFV